MKVSVIIFALNKKKILLQTIPSRKSSSLVDELIILDGHMLALCERYISAK